MEDTLQQPPLLSIPKKSKNKKTEKFYFDAKQTYRH
jgi:hypothetical protein